MTNRIDALERRIRDAIGKISTSNSAVIGYPEPLSNTLSRRLLDAIAQAAAKVALDALPAPQPSGHRVMLPMPEMVPDVAERVRRAHTRAGGYSQAIEEAFENGVVLGRKQQRELQTPQPSGNQETDNGSLATPSILPKTQDDVSGSVAARQGGERILPRTFNVEGGDQVEEHRALPDSEKPEERHQ